MNETELLLRIQRSCYDGIEEAQSYIDDNQDVEMYQGRIQALNSVLVEFGQYFLENE